MGLSRLSEKCKKCSKNYTCDNKRMEARAYIIPTIPSLAQDSIIDSRGLFIERERQPEFVGQLHDKPRVVDNDRILESIREAVEKGMICAIKASVI